jgi:hypothetical protein
MTLNSKSKLIITFITAITLLFVLPISIFLVYFIKSRESALGNINSPMITTKQSQVVNSDPMADRVDGSYPVTFMKPNSEWKSRIISDAKDWNKFNTMVFEIYKGNVSMQVNIILEDISELREFARNGDQKLKPLESSLEYKKILLSTAKSIDKTDLSRVSKSEFDNSQIIVNTNKKYDILKNKVNEEREEGYLHSVDLFPDYTKKYRNARMRTKITYSISTEENYLILDSIIPSIKLVENLESIN